MDVFHQRGGYIMKTDFMNTPDTTSYFDKQDIESNKVMALLCYIGILWLIPMLAAKDSKFAQYHVNQGIVLTLGSLVVSVACFIIVLIPILGWIVAPIAGLIPTAMMILGIVNVCQGKAKELPFIGSYRILK